MALSESIKQQARQLRDQGATADDIRAFIAEQLKPLESPRFELFKEALKQTGENVIAPPITKLITDPDVRGGAVRGATLGAFGETSPIEGSVFETKEQKTKRLAGRVTGSIVPLIGSELTGGRLAAKGGIELVKKLGARKLFTELGVGTARGAGTGTIFGTGEAIAQGKGIKEGTEDTVKTTLLFSGLGLGGQFLGGLRRYFGERMPKTAYESVLSVSKAQNKIDGELAGEVIAERASNVKGLYGTSEGMLEFSNNRISKLESELEGKIQDAFKVSQERTPEGVASKEVPLLEFKTKEIKPLGVDIVPEEQLPPFGQVVGLPAKEFSTVEPYGKTYQTISPKGNSIIDFSGKTAPESPDIIAKQESMLRDARREALRGEAQIRREIPKETSRFVKGPAIPTKPIIDSLERLEKEVKQGLGSKRDAVQVRQVKKEFIERFGKDDYIDVQTAQNLKLTEYKSIGDKRYQKIFEDNPAKYQAKRTVASVLRREIAAIIPGIGKINEELGLMYGIRHGIIDRIRAPLPGSFPTTRFATGMVRPIEESLLTSFGRLGRKTLGEPSTVIAPVTRLGTRAALEQRE